MSSFKSGDKAYYDDLSGTTIGNINDKYVIFFSEEESDKLYHLNEILCNKVTFGDKVFRHITKYFGIHSLTDTVKQSLGQKRFKVLDVEQLSTWRYKESSKPVPPLGEDFLNSIKNISIEELKVRRHKFLSMAKRTNMTLNDGMCERLTNRIIAIQQCLDELYLLDPYDPDNDPWLNGPEDPWSLER